MKNSLFGRRGLLNAAILSGLGFASVQLIGVSKAEGRSSQINNATKAFEEQTSEMQAKPTNIVLVHGAFADGSSWSGVIPLLQNKGFHVTAVQIPLTSLSDDVEVTNHVLAAQNGPTILVGHSYGGAVISAAGNAPNVVGLVYIAAMAPDDGESFGDASKASAPTAGAAQIRPDKYGNLWIAPEAFPDVFAADVDPVQARVMAAVQKPIAIKALGEKLTQPAWKSKPSWYLVSSNDKMIHPDMQRSMAKRMGATVVSLPTSHAAMVSRPDDVANLIAQAANAGVRGLG